MVRFALDCSRPSKIIAHHTWCILKVEELELTVWETKMTRVHRTDTIEKNAAQRENFRD